MCMGKMFAHACVCMWHLRIWLYVSGENHWHFLIYIFFCLWKSNEHAFCLVYILLLLLAYIWRVLSSPQRNFFKHAFCRCVAAFCVWHLHCVLCVLNAEEFMLIICFSTKLRKFIAAFNWLFNTVALIIPNEYLCWCIVIISDQRQLKDQQLLF